VATWLRRSLVDRMTPHRSASRRRSWCAPWPRHAAQPLLSVRRAARSLLPCARPGGFVWRSRWISHLLASLRPPAIYAVSNRHYFTPVLRCGRVAVPPWRPSRGEACTRFPPLLPKYGGAKRMPRHVEPAPSDGSRRSTTMTTSPQPSSLTNLSFDGRKAQPTRSWRGGLTGMRSPMGVARRRSHLWC
jgi:hypothetical protein